MKVIKKINNNSFVGKVIEDGKITFMVRSPLFFIDEYIPEYECFPAIFYSEESARKFIESKSILGSENKDLEIVDLSELKYEKYDN